MVVYTCILNNKDALISVNRQEGVRFVCFTDMPHQRHPVWEFVKAEPRGLADPRRVARRYKILSHLYFPGEDTMWIDGRVQLLKPVYHYIDKYRADLCARPHPNRTCIYQEAAQVKKINYEVPEIVDVTVERLEDLGYPHNNGLHETGILIRRATKEIEDFNNAWWAEVSAFSKRDQLSFDLTAWRTDTTIENIDRSEITVHRHKIATNFKQ